VEENPGAGLSQGCELCGPPRFHFLMGSEYSRVQIEYRFRKHIFHLLSSKSCQMPFCMAEQYRLQCCHFPALQAVPCSVTLASPPPFSGTAPKQPQGPSGPSSPSHCPSLLKTHWAGLVASSGYRDVLGPVHVFSVACNNTFHCGNSGCFS